MEARTASISSVIQRETLLRIPFFQRRYVWKEDDWLRFAIDMESTLDSSRKYFLGAIILKEEDVSDSDRRAGVYQKQLIIDGQQRLTTLSIFMKLLHMMTGKNADFENQYLQDTDIKDPVIIHSCEDLPLFKKIMHLDTPKELTDEGNIAKAYNFFRKYLDDLRKKGIPLNELLNTIKSAVTFVLIALKREDDEQQIFDTINSLGVPLTTAELLKNFLYKEGDEEAYKKNWKVVFDTDEVRDFWMADASKSRQAKNTKNTTIERFFHAFVRIKMWDFKDKLNESQKKTFVKTENVFSTCKAFVEQFGMDRQDLANEIITYAKLFKENLNADILDKRIPQHSGIKRISCIVNATTSTAVTPYVLYILNNVKDEKERNLIFDYLEKYLVRRMLVKSSDNNYSDFFSEGLIGKRICTSEALIKEISQKDDDKSLAMPKNSKIQFGINKSQLKENNAQLILYLYETKLTKTTDGVFNESYNTCKAEQMMPRPSVTANVNWPKRTDKDEENNRQQLIGTLGNYFMLRVDDNEKKIKKAHDQAFDAKKSQLLQWTDGIRCDQYLETVSEWKEKNIIYRNNNLAKIFNENIWII